MLLLLYIHICFIIFEEHTVFHIVDQRTPLSSYYQLTNNFSCYVYVLQMSRGKQFYDINKKSLTWEKCKICFYSRFLVKAIHFHSLAVSTIPIWYLYTYKILKCSSFVYSPNKRTTCHSLQSIFPASWKHFQQGA